MPDLPMRDLFEQITSSPDAEFVTRLRQQVLAELDRGRSTSSNPAADDDTAPIVEFGTRHAQPRPSRLSPTRTWERPSRRRTVVVLLVAAVIAATLLGMVTVVRNSANHVTTVPSTPPKHRFSQHVSTKITVGGSEYLVDVVVALPLAVESPNEPTSPTDAMQSDVLMLPSISGTLTNISPDTATRSVDAPGVTVQMFLRTDVVDCITNGDNECGSAIVRPQIADAATLGVGESVSLSDRGDASRTRVLRANVSGVLSQVSDGTLVTGFAVVLSSAAGDIATRIFDAAGQPVLSCAQMPIDCMDDSRSVLNAATAPAATVTAQGGALLPLLPPGEIPPGDYRVDESTIGTFAMSTYDSWLQLENSPRVQFLVRGDSHQTELVIYAQWLSIAPTAQDAIAHACPAGSVDSGPATPIELFGQPGMVMDGVVTGECRLELNFFTAPTTHAGDRIRLAAAEVNGVMAIVFAHAPATNWSSFSSELDKTIKSLTIQ